MTERSTRLKRKWLYIPFAVAAMIVFAYYLLWRAGAGQMKSAVADWVGDQRSAGFAVEHGAIEADGFPFFLRIHINDADIVSPNGWRWRAASLSLDALPYDLNKLIFSPKGEQVIRVEGSREWRVNASDLRASIANDDARGWLFAMNIGDATATRNDGARLTLGSLIFDLAPDVSDPTTLTLILAAEQADAAIDGETYSLSQLQTVASVSKAHLFSSNDNGAQWRSSGGALTITGFFVDLEETQLSASGEIGLGPDNHPAGTVTAEIENPAGLTRMLAKTGALTHNEAEAAAAGLTLMAFAGGGKIAAPIELTNGEAQIAGIKIADLPKVE